MEHQNTIFICPFCGHLTKMVWVHGHGQCAVCNVTIDECCRGEQVDCALPENDKIKEELHPSEKKSAPDEKND